jgi:hypothetical protein
MIKVIIIIGTVLGTLLIAGVILSLVAPKRITVQNTQFIKATKEQVYDQLRFMKNFPKWSPFLVQDPQQKYQVTGPDGEVGATYSWEGIKEKSKGSQRVAKLKAYEHVLIECTISAPFQSSPTFSYSLHEREGGIEVVQQFDAELPIPSNIFGLLFNLKQKISSTNQQGLILLKHVSENTRLTHN